MNHRGHREKSEKSINLLDADKGGCKLILKFKILLILDLNHAPSALISVLLVFVPV